MTVDPATLTMASGAAEATRFVPTGSYRGTLHQFDYLEEEWFAAGVVDGHHYTTQLTVRRPRNPANFSGTLLVEPVHAASAAPMWIYTSLYQMRSGHGWAAVCSQKTVLEGFVRPTNPERYSELSIWSDTAAGATKSLPVALPRDPAAIQERIEEMNRINTLSSAILAQVGAALSVPSTPGPFADSAVRNAILMGHSQTGWVVTNYVLSAHDSQRLGDGAPVYSGYFPSGAPSVRFGPLDVPLVQVLSEGDIADPHRGPMRVDRSYRRDDSDDPDDRYRLYELAGAGHMGTRYPPYSENETWQIDPTGTAGSVPRDAIMNSLPHGELFAMGLDHLVQWVADGVPPPRSDRIETGSNKLFIKDDYGNSRGGVRCAQMDVPCKHYTPNPGTNEDGTPAFGVVGIEEPLSRATLEELYADHADYVKRFGHRLDELIDQGWLLPADADAMRSEAQSASVP